MIQMRSTFLLPDCSVAGHSSKERIGGYDVCCDFLRDSRCERHPAGSLGENRAPIRWWKKHHSPGMKRHWLHDDTKWAVCFMFGQVHMYSIHFVPLKCSFDISFDAIFCMILRFRDGTWWWNHFSQCFFLDGCWLVVVHGFRMVLYFLATFCLE